MGRVQKKEREKREVKAGKGSGERKGDERPIESNPVCIF